MEILEALTAEDQIILSIRLQVFVAAFKDRTSEPRNLERNFG